MQMEKLNFYAWAGDSIINMCHNKAQRHAQSVRDTAQHTLRWHITEKVFFCAVFNFD